MVKFPNFCFLTSFPRAVMHLKKYLSIFLIGIAFAVAGCSGDSNSGVNKEPIDDIDGDGIADIVDPDMDGDGIPNEQDPDDDNDGVEDSIDPTPPVKPGTKTCVAATILPPNDETFPGEDGELSWELLPQGCVLPETETRAETTVTVHATPQRTIGGPTSATENVGNCDTKPNGNEQCFTKIKVPEGCGQFAVVYDISEVGDFLGDTDLSKGVYKQKVFHKGKNCEIEPEPVDPVVNVSNLRSRTEPYPKLESTINIDGTVTASSSEGGAGLYKPASEITSVFIAELSEPKWSATPKGHMDIYTTGPGCSLKMINIDPNEDAGNYTTRIANTPPFTHYPDWASLQAAPEVEKCKVTKAPVWFVLGNFIVNWKEGVTFTINSYNP